MQGDIRVYNKIKVTSHTLFFELDNQNDGFCGNDHINKDKIFYIEYLHEPQGEFIHYGHTAPAKDSKQTRNQKQ